MGGGGKRDRDGGSEIKTERDREFEKKKWGGEEEIVKQEKNRGRDREIE